MVCAPVPMLKWIVSAPTFALASSIAARSVQTPAPASQIPSPGEASELSAVELTVKVVGAFGLIPRGADAIVGNTNNVATSPKIRLPRNAMSSSGGASAGPPGDTPHEP